MTVFILFLFLLNFGISWYNAWAVGQVWADTQAIGGMPRFMAWCGAIMSACGFTQFFAVVLALIAGATGFLPPHYVQGVFELTYVVIILPILGSGLAIWVDSLVTAWRERSFGSVGTAAWNTYAQIHNTYSAVSLLPDVLKDLGGLFDGDDDDAPVLMLMVLVVAFALFGGILTTVMIAKASARSVGNTLRTRSRQRA